MRRRCARPAVLCYAVLSRAVLLMGTVRRGCTYVCPVGCPILYLRLLLAYALCACAVAGGFAVCVTDIVTVRPPAMGVCWLLGVLCYCI